MKKKKWELQSYIVPHGFYVNINPDKNVINLGFSNN